MPIKYLLFLLSESDIRRYGAYMLIDRVIYPITTLGPGDRIAIWTQGCSKQCKNCASSELWKRDSSKNIPVNELLKYILKCIDNKKADGITITGGDPLEQPEELEELLKGLHSFCSDILLYTGYEYLELENILGAEYLKNLRKNVSVLIDGRYIDDKNDNKSTLIGSVNQNIIYFDESVREKYEDYIRKGRQVQNVYYGNSLMSVGIHNKDKGEM